MPEQTNSNMDNYAYERDLILLNNLLMKRLLQQRMRMNGDANSASNNNNNTSKNKKTISDVYVPVANVNNAVATREAKKNFSMVEARKAAATLTASEQSILHPKPPHSRPPPVNSSRHSPSSSRNISNTHSEHLATVSEEPSSEKASPVERKHHHSHHNHHHHHSRHSHHHHNQIRRSSPSSSSAEESTCEKQATPPGQSSQPPSTISSTPDSEQSFRKSTPTRNAISRKSTVQKINIRQIPSIASACKQPQTSTKCCEDPAKKPTTCNNQCPTNVCPPQRPFFPPPLNNPFRAFNFSNFYYPYGNSYNYPLLRNNFNSFPQFNSLQPYNFQSSPFYLPNYFSQRPLEPLKPLKPLPMSHFQTNPLNGQPIIVL